MVAMTMEFLSIPELTGAVEETLRQVKRSLVQVRNGHAGAGAGIIWSADGWVLTNNHVVGKPGGAHKVFLEDGTEYPAILLGRDPDVDLAMLKIDAQGLPAAQIADSRNARVGELLFAVGHPWGQPGFVTSGILSSVTTAGTRHGEKIPVLRTDVALAPGNSGGPLVNAAGEVVGINTMIVGGDQGIAIPIHLAVAFAARLQTGAQAAGKPSEEIYL
jgi:serine protease Do